MRLTNSTPSGFQYFLYLVMIKQTCDDRAQTQGMGGEAQVSRLQAEIEHETVPKLGCDLIFVVSGTFQPSAHPHNNRRFNYGPGSGFPLLKVSWSFFLVSGSFTIMTSQH
jgi:hypothetical protein